MNKNKQQFADVLTSQGKTYQYRPKGLDLGIPQKKQKGNKTFIPDFYCLEDSCYYHVCVQRQSVEQKKKIVKKLKDVKIILVYPNGNLCFNEKNVSKNKIDIINRKIRRHNKHVNLKGLTVSQAIILIKKKYDQDIRWNLIRSAMKNYNITKDKRGSLSSQLETNYYGEYRTSLETDVISWFKINHKNKNIVVSGETLKAYRKQLKLTQQQFADEIGTTGVQISYWESERFLPSSKWRNKLITFLKEEGVLQCG